MSERILIEQLKELENAGHRLASRREKNRGLKKIELLSNTRLVSAIQLCRKLGFKEVRLPAKEYERADIKMELKIS